MSRWKPLSVALFAVLGALWLAPGASATVYCVDDTPGELADNLAVDPSCETAQATIAAAVTTANGHSGADSVLIGPGEFTLPGGPGPGYDEVYYYSAGDPIELRDSGAGATHLTMGSTVGMQIGLWIDAPAGSKVSDLELTIPANSDGNGDRGMVIGGGVAAEDVRVDGPEATNATGVLLGAGTPSLLHSVVEMPTEAWPTDEAVLSTTAGASSIADATLSGSTGVRSGGGSVTVERTSIDARTGVTADSGAIVIRDSLIELGNRSGATGVDAANLNAGTAPIQVTVDGATIVGGGANSVGVRAQADNGEEAVTATVASTVIQGPLKPLQVLADNGRTASLAVSYSNFDYGLVQVNDDLVAGGETGTANYEEAEVTDLEPGFADATAGDYRLAAGSPLIDAGDPAAPPAGELDLAGNARALAGTCPLAAGRRDVGAYEFAPSCPVEAPGGEGVPGGGEPTGGSEPAGPRGGSAGAADPSGTAAVSTTPTAAAPDTTIKGPRRVATARRWAKVRLRLSAAGEAAGFRCEVDGRSKACGAALSLRLKRGRHTVRAWALGAGGADPTPARIVIRVVAKRPSRA